MELCEEFGFKSQGSRVWILLLHSLARSPQTMLAIAWPLFTHLCNGHDHCTPCIGLLEGLKWAHGCTETWSPRCGEREAVVILKRGLVTWVSSGLNGRNAERYWGKFSFFASFIQPSIYMYICMYIYIHIHIYTHIYVYMYTSLVELY